MRKTSRAIFTRRDLDTGIRLAAACGTALIAVSTAQVGMLFFGEGSGRATVLWNLVPAWPLAGVVFCAAFFALCKKSLTPATTKAAAAFVVLLSLPVAGFDVAIRPLAALIVSYDDAAASRGTARWIVRDDGTALVVGGRMGVYERKRLDPEAVLRAKDFITQKDRPETTSCEQGVRLDSDGAAFGASSVRLRTGLRSATVERCAPQLAALLDSLEDQGWQGE